MFLCFATPQRTLPNPNPRPLGTSYLNVLVQFREDLFLTYFALDPQNYPQHGDLQKGNKLNLWAWLAPFALWIHSHYGFIYELQYELHPCDDISPVCFFGAFFVLTTKPQNVFFFSVQHWGEDDCGVFLSWFYPTSQVKSIFLFFSLFIYFYMSYFFFFGICETVVSSQNEPEPYKTGWPLPVSECRHQEEIRLLWKPFLNCHVYNRLQALLLNGYNVFH